MLLVVWSLIILWCIPGRKHLAFDGWTSPNTLSFIGLNIFFLFEGQICSVLLDYIPIKVGHTGIAIADRVCGMLIDLQLEIAVCIFLISVVMISRLCVPQVLGTVVDNASNNFTALRQLEISLPDESLLSVQTSIRCLCHTFNLVVKVCTSCVPYCYMLIYL